MKRIRNNVSILARYKGESLGGQGEYFPDREWFKWHSYKTEEDATKALDHITRTHNLYEFKVTGKANPVGRPEEFKKQDDILKAVESFWLSHNYPPTMRDLMALTGLGPQSNMLRYLRKMRESGIIMFDDGIARSIRTEAIDSTIKMALGEYLPYAEGTSHSRSEIKRIAAQVG